MAARKAHPGLAVADVAALESLAERLMRAGSPVRWDDRFEGVRRLYTEDPWGNRIELSVRRTAASIGATRRTSAFNALRSTCRLDSNATA